MSVQEDENSLISTRSNLELQEDGVRPLQFQRVRLRQILFEEYICADFKNSRFPMPENIRKSRNNAIRIAFFEFICALSSFVFYAEDRARIVLFMCCMSVLATLGGFYSKLTLSYWGLLAHACYSISIVGGFYIYIVISSMFQEKADPHKQDADPNEYRKVDADIGILITTSLPLFGLFMLGIYSLVLLLKLDAEYDARRSADEARRTAPVQRQQPRPQQSMEGVTAGANRVDAQKDNQNQKEGKDSKVKPALEDEHLTIEILEINDGQMEGNECVICMDKPKDTVFYPCGHQCLCKSCGDRFQKEARHQICPICRNRVKDIIRVYN